MGEDRTRAKHEGAESYFRNYLHEWRWAWVQQNNNKLKRQRRRLQNGWNPSSVQKIIN